MPTKRFSTISTRPIPCLPPSLFNVCITASGESFLSFTSKQLPFSNERSTCSASFGASSGATLNLYMPRISFVLASNHGSSKTPLSKLMWRRLRSVEYGFSALASTGILFAFANAIISARPANFSLKRSSRHGAITCNSGASAAAVNSKRT